MQKAAVAASNADPSTPDQSLVVAEVELQAECVGARAALAQGRDADAFKAAQVVRRVADGWACGRVDGDGRGEGSRG